MFKRLIIAGHSHADTLFVGRHREFSEPTLVKLDFDQECYGVLGDLPRHERYWELLLKSAEHSIIACLWAGNDHNGWFLLQVADRFDFLRDDIGIVDPTAKILPLKLVRERFLNTADAFKCREVLTALKKIANCEVVLVETPPPKGDDHFVRQVLAVEFKAKAEELGIRLETASLTPPLIRLKLWRTLRDAYAQIARECGVRFLSLPHWAIDTAGFLAREHWQMDATHASQEYGNRLRRHLIESLLKKNNDAPLQDAS